jgi:GNAT superfamily N-acetyltransferase
MTLRDELLAVCADTPSTVELRGLLLDGATEVRGDAHGAVLWSAGYSLLGVLGAPDQKLLARALLDVGDGDGWSVLALRAVPFPGLEWSRATVMTLADGRRLDHAIDASRSVVRALRRDELMRLPATHAAELAAAFSRGPVMCAHVGAEPASFAHVGLRTETHFDVSVDTLEPYRDRGLAQLTAAALIDHERRAGRSPVWGALDDNAPSLAVGRALGFVGVGELFVAEL